MKTKLKFIGLLLLAALFTMPSVAQASEGNATEVPGALQPLLDLLGGQGNWLVTLVVWAGALSVAFAWVSPKIKSWMADKMNEIAASADTNDDDYLRKIYGAKWYITLAFVLRMVGLQLPTLTDLERAIALQKEAAGK